MAESKSDKIILNILFGVIVSALLSLVVISFVPFINPTWHGNKFYTFFSMLYTAICVFVAIKNGKAFSKIQVKVLFAVVFSMMAVGIVSLFFIGGKRTGDSYAVHELCLCVYFGSLFGAFLGGLIDSITSKPKYVGEERDKSVLKYFPEEGKPDSFFVRADEKIKKHAKKNMQEFNLKEFKKTHPSLYNTMCSIIWEEEWKKEINKLN